MCSQEVLEQDALGCPTPGCLCALILQPDGGADLKFLTSNISTSGAKPMLEIVAKAQKLQMELVVTIDSIDPGWLAGTHLPW